MDTRCRLANARLNTSRASCGQSMPAMGAVVPPRRTVWHELAVCMLHAGAYFLQCIGSGAGRGRQGVCTPQCIPQCWVVVDLDVDLACWLHACAGAAVRRAQADQTQHDHLQQQGPREQPGCDPCLCWMLCRGHTTALGPTICDAPCTAALCG
jgi:hypothetical protein